MEAISLFSSAGIGELGITHNEIKILVSNELLEDRHALYKKNFQKNIIDAEDDIFLI